MQELITSIKRSIASENYQAALFIALSIPDICGQIQDPNIGNGAGARKWFDEYLAWKYAPASFYDAIAALSPEMVDGMDEEQVDFYKKQPPTVVFSRKQFWALRNAFLHNASNITDLQTVHLTHSTSHLNEFDGAIQISVIVLSNDICDGLERWVQEMNESYPEVAKRITQIAKIKNVISDGAIQFK